MSFDTLGLPEPLLRALATAGYAVPTDVQAAAIPAALAGRDLRVSSRTGSGKTASFMLPALARECGLQARIAAMFAGEAINTTEHRAVLHTALRAPADEQLWVDGIDVRSY